ncbi:uncharacterized protein LOC116917368 [Daphnia magna]|uniref:uncharacterized protein LOC116917368 n=1 Tax=Daphnia magna TaxID=35525 RepID=UPI001E1BC41F|nr:uncharacterized protein LOC116917368 [Daphnia magna]
MTLAVHRLLSSVQRMNPPGQSIDKAAKAIFYLSKLEKMGEEHIDYMIMTHQLRSLNIHTTPLMIASELHKLKKLLDHVTEHLQSVVTASQKGSADHGVLSDQYHSVFTHLNDICGFLKTLNQQLKIEDRIDYFLEAFQVSLDKFHLKAQELFCPVDYIRLDLVHVGKQQQQQTIVYAATIRQPKLHSNINDGCLLHQGFLWKRNGSLETRFWALLFTDSLLLTHVNNGVHFVEEEPILLCNMVRLLAAENQLNPSFRLVYRAIDKTRIGKVSVHLGCSTVTMRAKDRTQKITWVDLIRRQMDELQNREHCWNAASLCDKNEIGEQQPRQDNSSNRSGRGNAIGILRRVRRCLSTGAIPIPASMTIARSSSTLPPKPTTEPTFYQSYSCDDLYLVSDLTPGKFNSSEPITEQEHEFAVADERQQPDGEASGLVFHDISLGNPIDVDQSSNVSIEFVNLNAEPINEQNERHNFAERLRQRLFSRAIGTGSKDKIARAVVKGKNSGGGVGVDPCPTGGEEHGPGRQSVAPKPSSVLHVPHRATDCIQSWTARLCCAFFDCKSNQTSEIASATICLENTENEHHQPNRVRSPKTSTFQSVLGTITEDDGLENCKMRQFQSATNTDERHALHSTGDSTETSPSWASATSSAMETPNGVDQPLAFDFSRKCELNSDGRQQLVLPKCRVSASSRSSSTTRAPIGSIPVSYSMPTTPEMSEASPSPRQVSAGFFRFPFVGNASPRRFRSRAMSAESNSEETGPSVVVGSSSPPSGGYTHHHQSRHENPDPSLPVQSTQQTDKRLRFPRFLRRTHSASASTEAPPYALFLRSKRMVSKTRSADLTVAAGPNEVFSSVDDAAPGTMASRKTRLSEMRLRLGFLRRRSTESALSARPSPEEARKWSESFSALMASKYGAALYRAFLLREFSNENLEFWLACEEYKNSKPQKLSARAQKIYNDFVAVQATKEVNLDAETRLITLTNVQSNNPDLHAFDRAQRRIQHMMERDSYLRFLQSELFLELVHPERYPASSGDVSDKPSSAP